MKILHVIAAYKPAVIYGGPTMSVAKLCEQLVKAGHNVKVFTTTANGTQELDVPVNKPITVDGVDVTYFKRITKDHTHLSPGLLIALWKNARLFDAIHIHAWWNLVSILSCLIAVLRRVPVVVSPRGTLSPYSFQNQNKFVKSLIHSIVSRPLLSRSHIHVTSGRESLAIQQIISPKSLFSIPNFVKLGTAKSVNTIALSPPLKLIFFSRIDEKKGLDILFNALVNVTFPYRLTIAGDGKPEYINTLKALAVKNGISEYINWAGFVNDTKFDLLAQHDLFVLVSHDENFGNAVIESLSVGTAVLISEEVGLNEYVAKNEMGWLCKPTAASVTELINHIAYTKVTDLQLIRHKAPLIIKNDFNEHALVKHYTELYQSLING